MKNGNDPSVNGYTDVRFNLIYSICMILVGIVFVVWALLPGREAFQKYWFLIFGVILLVHGVTAISGSRYIRYDPHGKKIIFSGLLASIHRTVKYDKLFFKDKDLYRVINGKTRYINLIRSQCNRKDLYNLIQEINKGKTDKEENPKS